jgi:hypothetical protein
MDERCRVSAGQAALPDLETLKLDWCDLVEGRWQFSSSEA